MQQTNRYSCADILRLDEYGLDALVESVNNYDILHGQTYYDAVSQESKLIRNAIRLGKLDLLKKLYKARENADMWPWYDNDVRFALTYANLETVVFLLDMWIICGEEGCPALLTYKGALFLAKHNKDHGSKIIKFLTIIGDFDRMNKDNEMFHDQYTESANVAFIEANK